MSARLELKKQIIAMKLESFTKTSLVPLRVEIALTQGWAITFLNGPVTENELAYWAGDSKLNTELYGNQKRIYLPITSITASAHNNTASIPSDTTISGTDVAYCMCPKVCLNQA